MKRWLFAFLVASSLAAAGDHTLSAQAPGGDCPPELRKNSPELQREKEARKAELRRLGYPERFMKLVDLEECVYCLKQAPVSFGIMFEYKDNDYAPADAKTSNKWTSVTYQWTPALELQARELTAKGAIKGFYIFNSRSKCLCCPDVLDDNAGADTQKDWDRELDANRGHLIPFDDTNLGPVPEDLIDPDDRFVGTDTVPVVRTFQKPPLRQAHTTCKACAGTADKLNAQYASRDAAWTSAVKLMHGMSITQNAIAKRENEIQRMLYKQRFAATRLDAREKEIAEARRVNEMQRMDLEKDGRELAKLGRQVAEGTSNIERLEKLLVECEGGCRTTVSASPTAVASPLPPPPVAASTPVAVSTPAAGTPPQVPRETPTPAPMIIDTPVMRASCVACTGAALRAERASVLESEAQRDLANLRGQIEDARQLVEGTAKVMRDLAGAPGGAASASYQLAVIANQTRRSELTNLEAELAQKEEAVAQARRDFDAAADALAACNARCATASEQPGANPSVSAEAACDRCTAAAEALRQKLVELDTNVAIIDEYERGLTRREQVRDEVRKEVANLGAAIDRAPSLQRELEQAQQDVDDMFRRLQGQRNYVRRLQGEADKLAAALADCNARCLTEPEAPTECFGDSCASQWAECTVSGSCKPVETDCGIPGVCTDRDTPSETAPRILNLANHVPPGVTVRIEIEIRTQDKVAEGPRLPSIAQSYGTPTPGGWYSTARNESGVIVEPYVPKEVRQWFNPVGLIARTLGEYVERWRGSLGPRPIITRRDLEQVARYSSGQGAGLPGGVHVLLTDRGGSTGKTVGMQILNLTGRPIRLSSQPFAVQPIKQSAQQKVQEAFTRLAKIAPPRIDLSAYCVEFLKAPPGPNTLLQIAPPDVQQKYRPMAKVLQSAYRVTTGKVLRPDSNPEAYADSIKQWSLWAVEQKFSERTFTEAFLAHTRKNVEAAGQKWSSQAADLIRKAAPNRWNDIATVLKGAGVAVPQ